MMPWTGATPRRARYLIPQGAPRRREVVAGCAVATLVAHLLLAQVTLVLAVIFVAVSRASRWRRWWLLGPAAAGLAWVLAAGPASALAGFTAGPASILGHLGAGHLGTGDLGAGHLAGRTGSPLAGFAGAWTWLPRQLPVALITGAAEAALIGWLDWLHADEWAVPAPRPGLIAAARRAVVGRAVRGGGVVTREGIALGVVRATGARAELRWAEAAHGTLITGAAAQDVTLAGLQMVHAALRLRKPVIVLDPGDPAIAGALDTACAATGVPLLAADASGAGLAASGRGGPAVGAGVRSAVAVGADADAGSVVSAGAGAVGASGLWGRAAAAGREPGGHAAGNSGRAPGVQPRPGGRVTGNPSRLAAAQHEFRDQVAGNLGRAPAAQREPGGQMGGNSGRLAAAQREFRDQVAGKSGRVPAGQPGPGGLVADDSGRAVAGDREPGGQVAEVLGHLAEVLGRAVRERSAVLVSVGTAERAARVCAELGSLAAGLRRIGVDGDALVWVPRGESVPASALAGLLRDGPGAGLAIVIATTSPATATELRGLTGSALIYRVADPDLAAGLVTLAGTRLLPRSVAMRASVPMAGVPMAAGPMTAGPAAGPMASVPAAGAPLTAGSMAGVPTAAGPMTSAPMAGVPMAGVPMAGVPMASFPMTGVPMAGVPMAGVPMAGVPMAGVPVAGAAASMDATDLVPCPVMPALALLELGQAEFVLAVSRPRPRVVTAGQMVSARLPPTANRRTGLHTGDDAGLGTGDGAGAHSGDDEGLGAELHTGDRGELHAGNRGGFYPGDHGGPGAGDGPGVRADDSAGHRRGYRTARHTGYRTGYHTGRPGAAS